MPQTHSIGEWATLRNFEDTLAPQEKLFAEAIRDLWDDQLADTLKNLEVDAEKSNANRKWWHRVRGPEDGDPGPFNPAMWEEDTIKAARPGIVAAIEKSGNDFAFQYGFRFNPEAEAVQRWLGRKLERFSMGINDTTQKLVNKALVESQAEGEGIREASARLRAIFTETGDEIRAGTTRSQMIARTEMVSANNKGKFESALQSGLTLEKMWITAIDGRERATHNTVHRTRLPMLDLFQVGSDQMDTPGNGSIARENINCRCTWREIVVDIEGNLRGMVGDLRCPACERLHAKAGEIKCKCGEMVSLIEASITKP